MQSFPHKVVYLKKNEVSRFLKSRKGLTWGDAPGMMQLIVITVLMGGLGVYVLLTLSSALNNSTFTAIVGNATAFFTNFFGMFDDLGTISAVALLIVVVFGAIYIFGRGRSARD